MDMFQAESFKRKAGPVVKSTTKYFLLYFSSLSSLQKFVRLTGFTSVALASTVTPWPKLTTKSRASSS